MPSVMDLRIGSYPILVALAGLRLEQRHQSPSVNVKRVTTPYMCRTVVRAKFAYRRDASSHMALWQKTCQLMLEVV
jgi:hypothetical protein